MKLVIRILLVSVIALTLLWAQSATKTFLPHRVDKAWPQLPEGWNFGMTSGVSVDREDNVWVFNRGQRPVIQFDQQGKMLRSFGEGVINSSHGVAVGPDGGIWAVDVGANTVFKFSPEGRIQFVIGHVGGGAGTNEDKYGFNKPTGVAFDSKGNVYVSDGYANTRVVKYSPEGEYLMHWGKPGAGAGEFNLVHDVAIDANDHVYVADRTNKRVQVFDSDGKYLNKWTDVGTPWGLDYEASEDVIYMADGENNQVTKLNLDGQVLGILGSFGKAPGKFDFAHHLDVDSRGNIYVAEIKNWRVQKFVK
jgi:DNA-binding beta-propeller fold protein YncE